MSSKIVRKIERGVVRIVSYSCVKCVWLAAIEVIARNDGGATRSYLRLSVSQDVGECVTTIAYLVQGTITGSSQALDAARLSRVQQSCSHFSYT